jgi:large subunit ribosomal protein L16
MGRGKGNVDHWVSYVKPGKILFEVYSNEVEKLKEALKFASRKIPLNTQIITRDLQL